MFLVIPEASNALKWMFFDALVIQEPSQIDPGLIWENLFFHENFHQKCPQNKNHNAQKTHMNIKAVGQIFVCISRTI